jgi:hypothetical protein
MGNPDSRSQVNGRLVRSAGALSLCYVSSPNPRHTRAQRGSAGIALGRFEQRWREISRP